MWLLSLCLIGTCYLYGLMDCVDNLWFVYCKCMVCVLLKYGLCVICLCVAYCLCMFVYG